MENLTYNERQEKAREIGAKTKEEALALLNKHGKCLVVRPTGIGKTYLLNKVAQYYKEQYPDKNVVYLYPTDIIINEIKSNSSYADIYPYVTFESFQTIALAYGSMETDKIQAMSKEERNKLQALKLSKQKYIEELFSSSSIVLIDEVHRAASENLMGFFDLCRHIFGKNKVHLLGATATIERSDMDETDWIKQELFDGVEVSTYTLGDAFLDGILLFPIVFQPVFNLDKEIESIEGEYKRVSAGKNYYNEDEIHQVGQELVYEWGNNGKDIYEAMEEAGYRLDSDNPDDSFMRFIVFFKDTKHMVDEGANIEEYFRLATNSVASNALGKEVKTDLIVEYVISTTADKSNDYIVKKHCSEESYRIYRDDAEDVCQEEYIEDGVKKRRYIQSRPHTLSLIFNINTIIMGYHVPDISGIMQLRKANTSILFYQQLGRCFSIKSTKRPIVYDVVSNLLNDFDRQSRSNESGIDNVVKHLILDNMSKEDREVRGDDLVKAIQVGVNRDAGNLLLDKVNRFNNPNFIYIDRIIYLYTDRHMPIAFIAQDVGVSCSDVVKILTRENIQLKDEHAEYKYIMSQFEEDENNELQIRGKRDTFNLLRYLNSKHASKTYDKYNKSNSTLTLFSAIAKMVSRR